MKVIEDRFFTLDELKVIAGALVVQEKSVMRLAAKEGQPENVAAEYRKVRGEIEKVMRKVIMQVDELTQVKK